VNRTNPITNVMTAAKRRTSGQYRHIENSVFQAATTATLGRVVGRKIAAAMPRCQAADVCLPVASRFEVSRGTIEDTSSR